MATVARASDEGNTRRADSGGRDVCIGLRARGKQPETRHGSEAEDSHEWLPAKPRAARAKVQARGKRKERRKLYTRVPTTATSTMSSGSHQRPRVGEASRISRRVVGR